MHTGHCTAKIISSFCIFHSSIKLYVRCLISVTIQQSYIDTLICNLHYPAPTKNHLFLMRANWVKELVVNWMWLKWKMKRSWSLCKKEFDHDFTSMAGIHRVLRRVHIIFISYCARSEER